MSEVNYQHKDRLFRRVFQKPEDLLDLYNAVNGSHYSNPEDLVINTLEDVIYLTMKNDTSFLLGDTLNLWEHQSSYNPNIPVRGLSYFARLYQAYIEENQLNIYSSRQQKLPYPQFIVFYNGRKEEPDRSVLKLSSSFVCSQAAHMQEPALEVQAVMLNINWGRNRELMDRCQKLREYAQFIAKVRKKQAGSVSLKTAVQEAIDECIKEGILAELLSKQKSEVVAMFLTEFDAEKQKQLDYAEGVEDGKLIGERIGEQIGEQKGIKRLADLTRLLAAQNRIDDIIRAAEDSEYQQKLFEEFGI